MSDTPAQTDPRDLRVSDDEREHVVGLLQRAIGRGLLNLDEFTERADIAYAATTRAELNVVLADLPGLVHRDAPRVAPAQGRTAGGHPSYGGSSPLTGDVLELTAHASNLHRSGRWSVPRQLRVRNRYGNTRLDFSEAQFSSEVVDVELDAKWGSVEIVLPEGGAVDLDGVTSVRYGSLDDRTRSNGMPGSPRIRLFGRVHGGSVKVRYPSGWRRSHRGWC